MALTTEELEQIRAVVRTELTQSRQSRIGSFLWIPRVILIAFLAVLMLHVLVIGGFTVYHLMRG